MIIRKTTKESNEGLPTVSIVIAAYNASPYIRETLDSVLAQTFTNYEVIVVNDGSDDSAELVQILESHPLPVLYIFQQNKGVSAARNAAINVATGEFYAQLDADDQWTPEYLEVQLRLLNEDPNAMLVYPNAMITGDTPDVGLEFMKVCPSEGEVNFETLVRQKCIVMTCVTAHMRAIREAGMFDESLRSCEDFDLWLRIARNGGRIIYHRRALVLYRRHEGSLSSDRVWMVRHLLAVLEKCKKTLTLTSGEAKILNEEITSNRAVLNLFEGKRALTAGDASVALDHFKKANEHLQSPKLALIIFLLQHLPRLVIWTFTARERFLVKQPQHQLKGIDYPRLASSSDPLGKRTNPNVFQ